MKIIIRAALLLFIWIISLACDCNSEEYITFSKADLVFIGKVIKIEGANEFRENRITFQILKLLKGCPETKNVVITVPCLHEMCCGIDFKMEKIFTVSAEKRDAVFVTNLCSETYEKNNWNDKKPEDARFPANLLELLYKL